MGINTLDLFKILKSNRILPEDCNFISGLITIYLLFLTLFTYYFLKALQGDADSNADKNLTLSEIKDYVDENVPYMARRLNNRVQTPQLITDDQTKIMVTY